MARASAAGEGDRAERIGTLIRLLGRVERRVRAVPGEPSAHDPADTGPPGSVARALRRLGRDLHEGERAEARRRRAGAAITAESWRRASGRSRPRGRLSRLFFARGTAPRCGQAERLYLPVLVPGIAASALHALMRLAYAHLRNDAAEIATSLGYWAVDLAASGRGRSGRPRHRRSGRAAGKAAQHRGAPPARAADRPSLALDARGRGPAGLSAGRRPSRRDAGHAGPAGAHQPRPDGRRHDLRGAARRDGDALGSPRRRRLARSRPRRPLCLAGAGGRLPQDRDAAASWRR